MVLYFGSFNPVHNGHLAVGEWILKNDICDEVWFVVSPHNPLKEADSLIGEAHRLAMVALAVGASPYACRMKACDVEFTLPRPSYTIDTLSVLGALYPDTRFSLLVGSDVSGEIERWKEWERLLDNYRIYVYPRRGYSAAEADSRFTVLCGAPYEDFSSTEVRMALATGEAANMLPEAVTEYIKSQGLWKTTEI